MKVSALYDLYNDLTPIMEPACTPESNPWRAQNIIWDNSSAPEGLSPFALVRYYLNEYREKGALSLPPDTLATSGLSSPGGLWISLRGRAAGHSLARMGTWCFPEEADTTLPRLVAEVCWNLARNLPSNEFDLEQAGVGLSLFGPLEKCTAAELDNEHFGVVCRSQEREWIVGGALPHMPGIYGTSHQLRHALYTNTHLRSREPFDLHRHTVTKLIEPGARWPSGGCSAKAHPDPDGQDLMAAEILERARLLLSGANTNEGASLFFFNADYLFISIFEGDRLCACVGSRCDTVAAFDSLVLNAAQDPRYTNSPPVSMHVQLSVLSERWSQYEPPEITPGKEALGLVVDGVESIMLPGVAIDENLDADAFAAALYAKSNATEKSSKYWSRFQTRQWLSSPKSSTLNSHASVWVANHTDSTTSLVNHARGWFRWLNDHVTAGTLPESALPVQSGLCSPASPDLYAEAVRRLRQAAPILGEDLPALPLDLLPRDPDLLTLAHGHAAAITDRNEGLSNRLRDKLAVSSPRYEPISFWRAVEAMGLPDARVQRWQNAPVSPYTRIVRLCAVDSVQDTDWLCSLVSASGVVHCHDADYDDTLMAARAAEALALTKNKTAHEFAEKILTDLSLLSINLENNQAAIRASNYQTGLRTEHTVAALAAFVSLQEASS